MEVEYKTANQIRYSECRAWLIEYDGGSQDILLTSKDMKIEEVVHMISHQTHGEYTVCNITVGQWPLMPKEMLKTYDLDHLEHSFYFGDARKVDQDGMVQL
jgi:hypothetical protein